MKKMIACMLLVVMAAAVLTGCTTSNANLQPEEKPSAEPLVIQTFAPEDIGQMQKYGGVLFWDTFTSGGNSNDRLSYKLYTDGSEFFKDFEKTDSEFISRCSINGFKDLFVVAVYITVPTGGHSFSVKEGSVSDGALRLDLTETSPEEGTAVTQAFVTHCVLAAFDSKLYSEGMKLTVFINGEEFIGNSETM